jgi:hypothetical protein
VQPIAQDSPEGEPRRVTLGEIYIGGLDWTEDGRISCFLPISPVRIVYG